LKRLLKDQSGLSFPLTVAIALALVMILCGISEYMRLQIIARGIRDTLQSAIISTVNDNYADVYHGVREGYAGGYQPIGGGFEESVSYGDIYGRLDNLLGLTRSGGYHVKRVGAGQMEFRLSGLSVEVMNMPLAPDSPSGARKFTANASIRLEAPVSFGGKSLPPLAMTLKVRAAWTEKF